MNQNTAADPDALYYLYLNGDWAGPYQTPQIREMVDNGTVERDAFAYAATQQRHFTVDELLAPPSSSTPNQSQNAKQSTHATHDSFDDTFEIAPEQAASFDHVLPDLQAFYRSYLGITERNGLDRHQAAQDLRDAHKRIKDELSLRCSDVGALSRLINEIDEVCDYIANRQQLAVMWQQLSELEKLDIANDADAAHGAANAVLQILADRAEQMEPEADSTGSVLLDLDVLDDDADSVITRKILISARSEVANTKRDMDSLQQAYSELQEQHAKDLEKARKLLEKAEAARAEERHLARQTAAEVRNLAAEIQRLANEPDVIGGSDQELIDQVAHLGEELSSADISSLAYIAEDVLIRLIGYLRDLAESGGTGDTSPLREELARARESMADSQKRVEELTAECDSLRQQYEQQRITAEKASERASDREHRLRSTVTALEVTKELHAEVMEDLKIQLQAAQSRVESMENELATVRGEMQNTTGSVEARGRAIESEMERMVEMKAMLEIRSNELSASLKDAEDQLAKAQTSEQDTSLAEALAAKVNALRHTFDATTYRLKEQEQVAERLAKELEASRIEADELRRRSDSLSTELSDARSSLTASKRRLDELNDAYSNLEAEREALQTELHHRRSTDTIHKTAADQQTTERITKLEKDALMLTRQLANEKRQVEALTETKRAAEERVQELIRERDELRTRLDALQKDQKEDHARHASAIAVSTQAAIEYERRIRDLQDQINALEGQYKSRKGSEGDTLEPSTVRVTGRVAQDNALESAAATREELTEIARLRQERDQIKSELDRIKTEVITANNPKAAANDEARLQFIEVELTNAQSTIKELEEKQAQAVAERDRVKRELERLKVERESAAVEHRTALKSARDRLAETQARVAELEAQLAEQHDTISKTEAKTTLDQSLAEQERLGLEVQKLASELARLNGNSPTDRDQHLIGLAKASQQLAVEQERVLILTRSLTETLQQAESARSRTEELRQLVDARTSERDRLQTELDRIRAESSTIQLGDNLSSALAEAINKRNETLEELESVRDELDEVRGKLNDANRKKSTLEQIGTEQQHIEFLEKQLDELRTENEQQQKLHNETKARLQQALAERDTLAAELSAIRSRPDHSAELKMLRRRLVRAKRMIKQLRRERDEAISAQETSTLSLNQLSAQVERMKGTQRAVAEAMGIPVSAISMGADSAFNLKAVERPATHVTSVGSRSTAHLSYPSQRLPSPMNQTEIGFTSAFGKPKIPSPGIGPHPTMSNTQGLASQTHVTSVLSHKPKPGTSIFARASRHPLWAMSGLTFCVFAAGFFLLPPIIPIANQAIVNARISTVTAPIEGIFSGQNLAQGNNISRQSLIGVIHNDHVDMTALQSLEAKLGGAQLKYNENEKALEEARAATDLLTAQINGYRNGLTKELEQRLTKEKEELAIRESKLLASTDESKIAGLQAAVSTQRPVIDDLERRLASLRSGQFEQADLPVVQRRFDEAQNRILTLEEQQRELNSSIKEFEHNIQSEKTRVAALREANIVAPETGVLWTQRANDRQFLSKGDEVLRLADPQSIEIEALLPERYRDQITMNSVIEIIASGDRHIRGRLAEPLQSADHVKVDRAANLASAAPGYYKMYIKMDEATTPPTIGQKVKIIVLGEDPGFIKRSLAWFYEATRL